jgi:hypothetical protein
MAGAAPTPITSLSVVIPTIGRARLAAVVDAALADPATTEVVVVADRDRPSVERVLAAADLADEPRVVLVDGAGRGPAAARQTGIVASHGDVVVLLDDDVVPEPGSVTAHRAAHAMSARAVVVGPMPVAPSLCAQDAVARIYANDYDAEWTEHVADPSSVLRDLWGGNVSLRRSDALDVPQVGDLGDLRNREDQEWGLRAARAGMNGAVAPRAAAVHWHERDAAALLAVAEGQVRVGRVLSARYEELPPVPAPGAGLPRAVRAVVELGQVPVIGGVVRRVTIGAARRFGDGPPTRWRTGLLVVARTMVQRAA